MRNICKVAYSRALCCLLLAGFVGCAPVGPQTIVRDRTDYGASITESWKRQLLLNIVNIRYVEPLFFVDVGDIVAGYTLETGAHLNFSRSWFDLATSSDSSMLEPGVSGRYTDRPTITYRPMTGTAFLRGIMSPIPLSNVLAGLDSGVSAHFLIQLVVRSINGTHNPMLKQDEHRPGDYEKSENDFFHLVEILSDLQKANALHVMEERATQGSASRFHLFLSPDEDPEASHVARRTDQLRRILGLEGSLHEYEIVAGTHPVDSAHIAIKTFSLMQVLAAVSSRVDIPAEDIAASRAIAIPATDSASGDGSPGAEKRPTNVLGSIRIRSSLSRPQHAFAAVKSHGHWFWVDDTDLMTKRVFSFLMLAFTLMESNEGPSPLQITIPAQ